MIIKVCGMREPDNIRAVEALGINWMGFIFWPKSSRYVSQCPSYLPSQCKRVGVFVDAAKDDILNHIEVYGLDIVQLHGHESPKFIHQLRQDTGKQRALSIIKAVNIATRADLAVTDEYKGEADYFLFDTKAQMVGGNGIQFDWSVLTAYQGPTPFLLSGGIGPDDAAHIKEFHHPQCIGIDLNSRFEQQPALKDIRKIKQFIQQL